MSKLFVTNKLKELREENGWSRKEFADLLSVQLDQSVSQSLVQMWEIGERPITPDLALEIARLYKIDLKELVERR